MASWAAAKSRARGVAKPTPQTVGVNLRIDVVSGFERLTEQGTDGGLVARGPDRSEDDV